jgi:hypothetical protein
MLRHESFGIPRHILYEGCAVANYPIAAHPVMSVIEAQHLNRYKNIFGYLNQSSPTLSVEAD